MSGSRLQQHGARLRTGLAQLVPAIAHTGAAAGDLRAQQRIDVHRIDRGGHNLDRVERDLKFFGQQLRQRGVNALTHFRPVDQHRDAILTVDLEPGDGLSALGAQRARFAATAQ